jgi:hypothetical protein
MKEFNQKLLSAIYGICERDGAITNVGPEYYSDFLNIPERGMEALIACIICDRAESINRKLYSNEFGGEEKLLEYITDFLDMMAQGIVGIGEANGKLVFSKPVGLPPDSKMEKKIDNKIKSSLPIIKKVLLKSCRINTMYKSNAKNE